MRGGPFADTNRKEANAAGFRVDRLGLISGGAAARMFREFARATRAGTGSPASCARCCGQ